MSGPSIDLDSLTPRDREEVERFAEWLRDWAHRPISEWPREWLVYAGFTPAQIRSLGREREASE